MLTPVYGNVYVYYSYSSLRTGGLVGDACMYVKRNERNFGPALHFVISQIQSSMTKCERSGGRLWNPERTYKTSCIYKNKYFNGYILFTTKWKKTFRTLELFIVDWL